MFPYCQLKENDIKNYMDKATESLIKDSLQKEALSFSDFLNFLSPAAENCLPELRKKAAQIKRQHFGKTVRLYSPLYLSNYCINQCKYCGFRSSNKKHRTRLTIEEAFQEATVIKSYGINSLLLVSGEDPQYISLDYLETLTMKLKELFSYISIEIYPLSEKGYKRLFNAGVHGLTLYQETYDRPTYNRLHPEGPKKDYHKRLEAVVNGAKAKFYNIGLGVLLGLYDWRIESVSLAAHALWLRKHFWQTAVQFSFPRITPIEGGFTPEYDVTEKNLEQMMLSFRIFFPQSDIFLSTREKPEFRNKMIHTCVSNLSAASKVIPGGYAKSEIKKDTAELGQFSLHDNRSVAEIEKDLAYAGIAPVFKDWDEQLGGLVPKSAATKKNCDLKVEAKIGI